MSSHWRSAAFELEHRKAIPITVLRGASPWKDLQMPSVERPRRGKPDLGDYLMWGMVAMTMLVMLQGLARNVHSPVRWAIAMPMVVAGAWLIRRRWRFVRDGVPHI
jgi:hypothetical protein